MFCPGTLRRFSLRFGFGFAFVVVRFGCAVFSRFGCSGTGASFGRCIRQIATLIEIMFVNRRSAAEPIRPEHKVDSLQDRGFTGVVIADQYDVIREE